MNGNAQQQQPVVPDIDPRTFAALNEIDTFLGRAPLTRAEHQQVNNLMQYVMGRLDGLQKSLSAATAELAALKDEAEKQAQSYQAGKVVTEALNRKP